MLTARQETILKLIIDHYIQAASPIASDSIARNHEVAVSPATIRNDVAYLEEAGYLTRPHPSAGSVPVDKAYRFYVESLLRMDSEEVSPNVRWAIRKKLSELERDVDEWASGAATVLARLVGNMAIATFPKAKESRVRHIELVHLQDFLVMLIVVLEQARLRRHLITLNGPVEAAELAASTNKVKSQLVGLTHREIESKSMVLNELGIL